MARKPYVDKEECTQCELCVNDLPDVFQMDDEGFAEVHDPEGAGEDEIQEVMDNCPAACIHWEN